jgi:hypothetical protein
VRQTCAPVRADDDQVRLQLTCSVCDLDVGYAIRQLRTDVDLFGINAADELLKLLPEPLAHI